MQVTPDVSVFLGTKSTPSSMFFVDCVTSLPKCISPLSEYLQIVSKHNIIIYSSEYNLFYYNDNQASGERSTAPPPPQPATGIIRVRGLRARVSGGGVDSGRPGESSLCS